MIKENALKYLGYQNQTIDPQINKILDDCLEEIKQYQLKAVYQKYTLTHQPLMIKELGLSLEYPDLVTLFKNCQEVVVIACTLGIELDRKLKYYAMIDMTKMTILDALASSYLEIKCDQFQQLQDFKNHTFRFCPGYGNVPLALNQSLATALQCDKHIGLTVLDNYLLLPKKSMIGLIGIGDSQLKSCDSCKLKETCQFQKRGVTCYKKD